jgi:amino acid transporter
MKMACRKISLRIITLYCLAVLVGSFVVPSNHPFINGGGQSVGSHSIFIIAVVEVSSGEGGKSSYSGLSREGSL